MYWIFTYNGNKLCIYNTSKWNLPEHIKIYYDEKDSSIYDEIDVLIDYSDYDKEWVRKLIFEVFPNDVSKILLQESMDQLNSLLK